MTIPTKVIAVLSVIAHLRSFGLLQAITHFAYAVV